MQHPAHWNEIARFRRAKGELATTSPPRGVDVVGRIAPLGVSDGEPPE